MKVRLARSKIHGYGVVATKKIRKGQVVETNPFLFVDGQDTMGEIDDYVFVYNKKRSMIVLGFGSLYNYSTKPNIELHWNLKEKNVKYIAARTIQEGEECFIDYGEDYWTSRGITPK